MSGKPEQPPEGVVLTPEEKRRQARRNRAIGFALAALVLLFYMVTVFKMGPTILNRPL